MAYQTRQRDPLLDSNVQAAIEKRGKELLGVALILGGVLFSMLLYTFSPSDPSWFSANGGPIENWLGRFGATVASIFISVVGAASWAVPVALFAWGLRFVTHTGAERAVYRAIFLPIAVVICAVHGATYPAPEAWGHISSYGGAFGEMITGGLLAAQPGATTTTLKVLSAISGLLSIIALLFVCGCTRLEVKRFGRFMLVGLIMGYARLVSAMSRGVSGAAEKARQAKENRAQRKDAMAAEATYDTASAYYGEDAVLETSEPPVTHRAQVMRAEPVAPAPMTPQMPVAEPEPVAEPAAKTGLFARVPLLKKMAPEANPAPEAATEHQVEMDQDERIKARITDVIKSRVRAAPQPAHRHEPTLLRPKGPEPLVLNTNPQVAEKPVAEQLVPQEEIYQPAPPAPEAAPLQQETYVQEPTVEAAPQQPAPTIPAAPLTKPVVQHNTRKPIQPSRQAKAEAQPALQFDENQAEFELPPLSLLASPSSIQRHVLSDEALEENARMLENVLDDYGVKGEIIAVRPGPVVTMYELEPAPGLKASRVIGLADDIARSMSALSARVSTVPGRSVIGIELPNENREMVVLREILSARDFGDSNMKLPLALGKDIGGEPIVANLAKMPHLLIAGTTGSGKSVAINTMILSLLYKLTPEECRLIMIDPKMLELSVYDGIPHLLSPVVTDPKKAVVALKWVVGEMEERYRKMSKMGVRNIDGYNGRVRDALAKNEMFSRTVQTGFDDETGDPVFETEEFAPETMPYIVVVVDEMADLMMVAGKEIEACIQRLAQMARASGIHLIMATQRPSVDVITGTIKANFPTRISFQVTSKIDSRTILGEMGAEQLLGMGDMLYMAGGSKITRIHGPFCSDEEVEEIVNHLKAYGTPEYMSGIVEGPDEDKSNDIDLVLGLGGNTNGEDALYDQAVAIVLKDRKCSTSYIQRKLSIGYNKAARLVEQMEEENLVSAANHVGKREILVPEQ
ncbi:MULTISPECIES: DNA translocase FtsK [Halocynthiibacter]|uniref:DNA translocase FtsK n=1 Tax=Halocynthiibacter halioticoli TaxID=2986804 RepID=A0AAE3J123_9RHOB|nr:MULTISPECIES: DNA translocase FtsK [Halocynthiibacter]MCV6825714.1 DNA translocase FtsK [Halocynthiibacter halioticoli]MCW4058715.1 DNA translocase FtsK [Halocynthiibacter sp. SDUM655004]